MLRKIITVTIAVVMLFTMIGCGNTQATTNVSGTSEVAKGSDKSVEQTQQTQPDTKEQVTKEAETKENTSIVDIGIDYSKYRASYEISIQNEEVPAITKYIKSFGEITIDVGDTIYFNKYDGWDMLSENMQSSIFASVCYLFADYDSIPNNSSINKYKKYTICFMLDKVENKLFIMEKYE